MIKYNILMLFCFFAFAKAQAQKTQPASKIEKEEKIKIADFPKPAIIVVRKLGRDRKRIDYYRETDGVATSYEAKLKYKGARYSIEFNEQGVLEDVEITVKFRKIKKPIQRQIKSGLENMARRYRIEKVQRQYRFKNQTTEQLLEQIEAQEPDAYEMIVAFKDQRKIYRKELTFDSQGKLIKERKIKRIEYDFLLF